MCRLTHVGRVQKDLWKSRCHGHGLGRGPLAGAVEAVGEGGEAPADDVGHDAVDGETRLCCSCGFKQVADADLWGKAVRIEREI